MTETSDLMTQFFAERAARDEAAQAMFERNKAALMPILAEAGIAAVEIDYDGMADSGSVDEPVCLSADSIRIDCPGIDVEIEDFDGRGNDIRRETKPLAEALEILVYDALEVHHPGWEINEGAFGTFRIDVTARTMTLGCNLRTCDYHEDEIGEEG